MEKTMILNKELQLKSILKELPPYVSDYFDYCSGTQDRSVNTMLGYAYDIRTFFKFLIKNNPAITDMNSISMQVLNQLTPRDIQEYMSYLRNYTEENRIVSNQASARARKLSALRSFMQYLFMFGNLDSNPAKLIDTPKIHKKKQNRLNEEEVVQLLNNVSSKEGLTDREKTFAQRTTYRNIAIMVMLCGTGIRVSELTKLNLEDIDFKKSFLKVTRKGGNEDIVYFGREVARVLQEYIEFERQPYDDNNTALFLSSRHGVSTRLSSRQIERIVKRYGYTLSSIKKITPHTLRRSFGTQLYNETGDIYMVADALGHKNVQVTADHYTEIRKERKELVRMISDEFVGNK